MKKRILVLLFAAGFLAAALSAQALKPLSIDDFLKIKRLTDPQLSPCGKWVAYTVTVMDKEANKGDSDIWVAPLAGGDPRLLASSPAADHTPRWSPDGKRIAFISSRGGTPQIWRVAAEGGEPVQLTRLSTGRPASFGRPTAGSWPSPRRFIPRRPPRARSKPGCSTRSSSATGTLGATARGATSSSFRPPAARPSTSRRGTSTRRRSPSAEARTTSFPPTGKRSPSSATLTLNSKKGWGRTTTFSSSRPPAERSAGSRRTRPTTIRRSTPPTADTWPTWPWPGRDSRRTSSP